ncbi:MAG: T9SS type A sorting domain-containing protein [Bacteroidota bacterium]
MRLFLTFLFCFQLLSAWGGTTHKYINKNAVTHLPVSMQKFIDQKNFLETHASDADNRKGADPTEGPKHYLDIDYYPNFQNMTRSLDSLIAKYGVQKAVKDNGILPWATVWAVDSLTAQLKRGDWVKAYQTAADIGHYVADGHQPLHVAMNYNGQLSGNYGIHSRYESTMMGKYLSSIAISKDSVQYIADPLEFVFSYLLESNALVDSVIAADRIAAPPTGYSGGGTLPANYYSVLWDQTDEFTKKKLHSATIDLASLWYTAWVNAGLLDTPTSFDESESVQPQVFSLHQNYPNPFNPSTAIRFNIMKAGHVKLSVYSINGTEVSSLVNAEMQEGSYSIEWNGENFPSGVYFYRLESHNTTQTRKLMYIK